MVKDFEDDEYAHPAWYLRHQHSSEHLRVTIAVGHSGCHKALMYKVFVALYVMIYWADAFRITLAPKQRHLAMSLAVPTPGVSAPLGFFDPLGFSKTDTVTMNKYREAELKHGRVAMTAVFGWLTQEHFHPLYDGKLSGNPLKAFAEVPPLGFVQIVAFIGLLEYTFAAASKAEGYVPGDYLGVNDRIQDKNDPAWVGYQTRELNNGRLAMFAIMGEIAHAAITGKGALEQIGL